MSEVKTTIDFDGFQTIEKHAIGRWAADAPPYYIKVNSSSVTFGFETLKPFCDAAEPNKALISLAYSPVANALRISSGRGSRHGFVVSVDPKKAAAPKIGSLPKALKDMRIPRGNYEQHEEYKDVYVYAGDQTTKVETAPAAQISPRTTSITELADLESRSPEPGDIVNFLFRNRKGTAVMGTGIVEDVGSRLGLRLRPIGKNYPEEYPARKFVHCSSDKMGVIVIGTVNNNDKEN